jgi:hypothetical protein
MAPSHRYRKCSRIGPGLVAAALLLLGAAHPAWAVPVGTIEGLQMPAWVERHGALRPAWAGMRVHAGDRVRTGASARVLLRLDEGSHVRLGEDADFVLEDLTPPPTEGGRFRGFMNVIKGGFRFTTTTRSRAHERDLDVRVAGVTGGIRSADVWGKAAPDRDLVCLIAGEIAVQRVGQPPVAMSDPLTFYSVPKGSPALPVASVSPEQVARWAAEVELRDGAGITRPLGGWQAVLSSHRARQAALEHQGRLEAAGYGAAVSSVEVGGETWHRVVVRDLSGPEEARAFGRSLEGRLGVQGVWIVVQP